jgi:hypothetical protein
VLFSHLCFNEPSLLDPARLLVARHRGRDAVAAVNQLLRHGMPLAGVTWAWVVLSIAPFAWDGLVP